MGASVCRDWLHSCYDSKSRGHGGLLVAFLVTSFPPTHGVAAVEADLPITHSRCNLLFIYFTDPHPFTNYPPPPFIC